MKDTDPNNDIENIGVLVDEEATPIEKAYLLNAIHRNKDLEELDERLRVMRKAIKTAFRKGFLSE